MSKNMKKIMKFTFSLAIIALIWIGTIEVRADFVGDASNWYNKGGEVVDSIDLSEIVNLVNIAGTSVIAIVTVVLGIKYMLGSVNGKAEVKEQMISLLVACILFFGWSNLSGILISGATFNSTTGAYDNVGNKTQLFIFNNTTDLAVVFARIFAIVMFFARIVAIIVTMIIGLKYIFGGADVKSSIKQKGPMYIIGILMIFCTLGILSFISDSIIKALT